MKVPTTALVLGAASAVAGLDQQVLGGDRFESIKVAGESWMDSFKEKFGDVSAEAKAVWDEVTLLAPEAVEAFKKNALPSKPKPASRKPDSSWDHVVKGADVQDLWVETDAGKHRQVGGRLEDYNLRAKKVDPSKLGVDKVKQYSGYLDDEENDKHLFYCKYPSHQPAGTWQESADISSKGSSSPATTPRTTLSFSGSTVAPAAPP